MSKYTIGLDYGSLSGRGILSDISNGNIVAQEVFDYPHGVISEHLSDGTALPHGWALQDPQDYLLVLDAVIPALLNKSRILPESIIGIGIAFTAGTIIAVDESNTPLCNLPEYTGRPHAYAKLWKHHGAQKEAEQIETIATEHSATFLNRYGGKISSESMLSKILQTYHEDPALYRAADHFVEAGDWVSSLLAGSEIRSGSMASCKMMWDKNSGYPTPSFLADLEPELADLGKKLGGTAGKPIYAYPWEKAGELSAEMAEKLGLCPGTAIAAPQMDGYAALPATGVTEPGQMLMMAGTSTAMLLLSHNDMYVPGICAGVKDSGLPGYYCYAAGQASTGDCFQWFVDNCVPAIYSNTADKGNLDLHQYFTRLASRMSPGETGLIALDWWNGNKSNLVDADLSGVIIGLSLQTKPEHIYRALLEATAFGANSIIRNYEKHGISVDTITACGGIAEKNSLLMQIYADVLKRPVYVNHCRQAAALGAAIHAATAAGKGSGGWATVYDAIEAMADRRFTPYFPCEKSSQTYRKLMNEYVLLHDYFGCHGNDVMKRLRSLQNT